MTAPGAVAGRRGLRFESLDAMLADARACVAAEARGRLRRLGNWHLGTALAHVAEWADYPYVGYPPGLRFSDEVRARARARLDAILYEPMQPGERIEGAPSPAGTYGVRDTSAAQGLAMLEASASRLEQDEPTLPDPAFGAVTREQWALMTLRHAELHLGFYVPE